MSINIGGSTQGLLQQMAAPKDSLKFAGIEKTFSIIEDIPSTDAPATEDSIAQDSQISEIMDTLKALQLAKKSLSDAQSVAKDIKSNYKTEKNDAWAPVDDTMLRQRYEAVQQIKDIFKNATLNHKNVFTMDYTKDEVVLDLQKKSLDSLNLRDEHSINIFSDNLNRLSQQIEDNIQKLQAKIDKINQNRWLSMENLRNVRLEQKEVNAGLKSANPTPSLATALAQVAQNATQEPKAQITDTMNTEQALQEMPKEDDNVALQEESQSSSIANNTSSEEDSKIGQDKGKMPIDKKQNEKTDTKLTQEKQENITDIKTEEEDSIKKAEQAEEKATDSTQKETPQKASNAPKEEKVAEKEIDKGVATNELESQKGEAKEGVAQAETQVSIESSNKEAAPTQETKVTQVTQEAKESVETAQSNVEKPAQAGTQEEKVAQESKSAQENTNESAETKVDSKAKDEANTESKVASNEEANKEEVIDVFV